MNILFICPYTPTRIRTRPYNLIRSLARRGHRLTLATLWENERERAAMDEFTGNGIRLVSAPLTKARSTENMFRAFVSGQPLQSMYCWQPELSRLIRDEIANADRDYDLVHV